MSRITKGNSDGNSEGNSGSKVTIGNVSGCLVDLAESAGNFFQVVDADSAELQGAGCLCFDNVGEVREPMRSQLVDIDNTYSSFGWLYVKEISIVGNFFFKYRDLRPSIGQYTFA
jgi:hypothetical protein